jgi:type III restriction enzyme
VIDPNVRRYRSSDEDSSRWDRFTYRDGDVVISTRTKHGTTWMQMICLLLIHGDPGLPAPLAELSPWLDWRIEDSDEVLDRLARQQHRRVIKTHTPLDGLPLSDRGTYVVVARHPLDAAVSLRHQGDNLDRQRMVDLAGVVPAPALSTGGRDRPVAEWLSNWIDDDDAVLTIHSDATEDALARLATVEDPDSKVRVIVSVSMLKEGWDVKNIFVIASLRPSISDVLTEQTLGRGLRLPWGAYTDVDLLDTVEVLSHERYEQLLSQAGVLLEGLTESRVAPVVTPVAVPAPAENQGTAEVETVTVTPAVESADTVGTVAAVGAGVGPDLDAGELPAGQTGFVVSSLEARDTEAAAQVASLSKPVLPVRQLEIPKVTRTVTARNFSLSDVPSDAFTSLGKKLADAGGTQLERKRLDVIADPTAPDGYRLVPTDTDDIIEASTPQLPLGGAEKALKDAILDFDLVPATKQSLTAAGRLAKAVVDGAGGEKSLAAYLSQAIAASRRIVMGAYKASPEVATTTVEAQLWGEQRVNTKTVEHNRFGEFSKAVAYDGWKRSLYPLDWFDSKPERTFANTIDSDNTVDVWSRIQRGELTIDWEKGRYSPDFYVSCNGVNYLVEVKADDRAETDVVQGKKAAAERWARCVQDEGDFGEWHYVLLPEAVVNSAKSFAALLAQAGAQ